MWTKHAMKIKQTNTMATGLVAIVLKQNHLYNKNKKQHQQPKATIDKRTFLWMLKISLKSEVCKANESVQQSRRHIERRKKNEIKIKEEEENIKW